MQQPKTFVGKDSKINVGYIDEKFVIQLHSAMGKIFLGDTYKICMRETVAKGLVYVFCLN